MELQHDNILKVINYYTGLGNKDKKRKIPAIFNRMSLISRKGKEAWQDKQAARKNLQCLIPAGQSTIEKKLRKNQHYAY